MRALLSGPAAWRICGVVGAAALTATTAYAAQRTIAGTATIIRSMSVSTTAQMSFGKLQYNGAGPAVAALVLRAAPPMARTSTDVQLLPNGGETPAIRVITGEPGRIYRVTPPASATATPGGWRSPPSPCGRPTAATSPAAGLASSTPRARTPSASAPA
jgi:hypothetical protein